MLPDCAFHPTRLLSSAAYLEVSLLAIAGTEWVRWWWLVCEPSCGVVLGKVRGTTTVEDQTCMEAGLEELCVEPDVYLPHLWDIWDMSQCQYSFLG